MDEKIFYYDEINDLIDNEGIRTFGKAYINQEIVKEYYVDSRNLTKTNYIKLQEAINNLKKKGYKYFSSVHETKREFINRLKNFTFKEGINSNRSYGSNAYYDEIINKHFDNIADVPGYGYKFKSSESLNAIKSIISEEYGYDKLITCKYGVIRNAIFEKGYFIDIAYLDEDCIASRFTSALKGWHLDILADIRYEKHMDVREKARKNIKLMTNTPLADDLDNLENLNGVIKLYRQMYPERSTNILKINNKKRKIRNKK